MGAWGEGPFEADQVVEWTPELMQTGPQAGLDYIAVALSSVAEFPMDEYLEEDPAVLATAAAALLAASLGVPIERPASGKMLLSWVTWAQPTVSPELIELAKRALQRVLGPESELGELWDEQGDSWRTSVTQLLCAFD